EQGIAVAVGWRFFRRCVERRAVSGNVASMGYGSERRRGKSSTPISARHGLRHCPLLRREWPHTPLRATRREEFSAPRSHPTYDAVNLVLAVAGRGRRP